MTGFTIKIVAGTCAVLAILVSAPAQSRGMNRSLTNGKGNTVQSSGTAKTKFTRGQGVSSNSNRVVTGPKGNSTQVDHNGNTSYAKDEGVTHTADSTVTTDSGQTKSVTSESQTQKTADGITSTTSVHR